jgi:hypothetical protein
MGVFLIAVSFTLLLVHNLPGNPANQVQLVSQEELDKRLPSSVFLDGENVPVQRRNAVGARMENGKIVLVTLLDTSGFAAEYQQKYLGMLMTQADLVVGGKEIGAGAYGLGRTKTETSRQQSSAFVLYDLGGKQVAEIPAEQDDQLRPVMTIQLKVETSSLARLYLGRDFIALSSR